MLEATFIVAREGAELLLIGQATLMCMARAGRSDLRPGYWVGSIAGMAAGLLLGAWVATQAADARVQPLVSLLFLFGIVVLSCTMLSSAATIEARAEDAAGLWHTRFAGAIGFGTAAIVGLREAMEAVVLLEALADRHEAAGIAAGSVLGGLAVIAVAAVLRTARLRWNVLALYRASAVFLLFVAVQALVAEAGVVLQASLAAHGEWMAVTGHLLPGGTFYPVVIAAFMAVPLVVLARAWWWEAAAR